MTFDDLFDAVLATGELTRAKDRKSSLLHLAKAMGHASLEACPVDAALGHEDTWRKDLDAYFAAIIAGGKKLSAHTMGETRTNIRSVFHLAEVHGFLAAPLPLALLTRPRDEVYWRQRRAMSPVYARFHPQNSPRHYGLSQAQWPAEIAARLAALPRPSGQEPPPGNASQLCVFFGAVFWLSLPLL